MFFRESSILFDDLLNKHEEHPEFSAKISIESNSYMPILKLPASSNEEAIYFIEIYFDTSTYDKVEQDKKLTLEAQLGLIGGTMGLLTGFSILSGVEILSDSDIRFFVSLRMTKSK